MASKSYRKFMATGLTAAVVASAVAPVASAATFTDVPAGAWYKGAVDYVSGKGYMTGTSGTTFAPEKTMTRAEAATLFANKLELYKDGQQAGYTDVKPGVWYHNAVAAVKDGKIMGSTGDNMFSPDRKLTRGEVSALIVRAYDLQGSGKATSFTDIDKSIFKNDIATLVEWGIADGKTATTFAPTDVVSRAEMAAFIQKADEAWAKANAIPEIKAVSAVDGDTVTVEFNAPIADVDHTNFAVSGGVTVTKATLSADKKSVTLQLNKGLTSGAKYTVTATGVKNAMSGKAAAELKAELVYTYDYGITVNLSKTSLGLGETSKVVLKDKSGKVVTPDSITYVINNTNVVTGSGDTLTASSVNEGTASVTVKATLSDDTVVTNTFNVVVEEVVPVVENKGFTLVSTSGTAPANTAVFNVSKQDTNLYNNGEVAEVALFNTTNGDPDAAHVNFTGATVKSLNPTVATGAVSGSDLVLTANNNKQVGNASFEITFADKTKKTITVEVIAAPAFKEIDLSATSVQLSDESKGTTAAGVNTTTVSVYSVDQYGKAIARPAASKVTISTNEEGITLGAYNSTNNTFTITSKQGKVVPTATVRVNYFAKSTDTTPAMTKNVTVSVVNVDATKAPASIDVVPTYSSIDAAGVFNYETDLSTVYELDANGNRIGKATPSIAALGTSLDSWLDLTGPVLGFDASSLYTMSEGGKADLKVTASGITVTETIDFTNSWLVPHKAMVDTKPVSIKLATGDTSISLEEILFGKVDATQLLKDTNSGPEFFFGVKKAASNGGYKYNKPLVSITDVKSGAVSTGVNVYGAPTSLATGNLWDLNGTYGKFSYEATVVNSSDVTVSGETVTHASGKDGGTFTIVLKSVKVSGDTHTDANLLAAPVSVDVTLTK
ncbi:S-layer homology domain-containing protein [Fictibacillus nanhaiensis]|uniref:S-layer homology domain-containing protein n=1 Tax=Fictibacillus nanhaiensis TaxID=742169 RepID=UPI002E1CA8BA|nr:S-layer homology domain-containing protein [Fictibacillus nanhaiensis]